MVRRLARRQKDLEQILGLTQAQPDGKGNRGKLALLDRVEDGRLLDSCLQFGDPPLKLPDLGLLHGEPRFVAGGLSQSLFDLAGMFINRLATALRILGLFGH